MTPGFDRSPSRSTFAREAKVDLGRSKFSTPAETDTGATPESLSAPPYATWINKSR